MKLYSLSNEKLAEAIRKWPDGYDKRLAGAYLSAREGGACESSAFAAACAQTSSLQEPYVRDLIYGGD